MFIDHADPVIELSNPVVTPMLVEPSNTPALLQFVVGPLPKAATLVSAALNPPFTSVAFPDPLPLKVVCAVSNGQQLTRLACAGMTPHHPVPPPLPVPCWSPACALLKCGVVTEPDSAN